MKIKSVFALALQLLGIYAIINGLPLIGGLLSSLSISEGWQVQKYIFFGELVAFILLLLAGWFLLNLGNKISKETELSNEESLTFEGQINFTSLSELSFAIFGLYIIISTIPSLLNIFSDIAGLLIGKEYPFFPKTRSYLSMITSGLTLIIKVAFGIWLFLGSKGFVKLWQKLRQRWNYERNMDKK